ncbi:hypothetical protein AAZX31_16G148000 [Glycine max]
MQIKPFFSCTLQSYLTGLVRRVRQWPNWPYHCHGSASLPRAASSAVDPPPDFDCTAAAYYTSLCVVRHTFDDCRAFRSILSVDERLRESAPLRSVYVAVVYTGGAAEVRKSQSVRREEWKVQKLFVWQLQRFG